MNVPPELQKQVRRIILVGLGLFVVVNGCSWNPGYGGRRGKPGMEVERYFGWPACFYADLWRSEEATEVEPFNYVPPVPITRELQFVYFRFGFVPLLLDMILAAAATTIAVFLYTWQFRGVAATSTMIWAAVLGLVVLAIVIFGD